MERKICPKCGLDTELHTRQCLRCGHQFRTLFATPADQTQTYTVPTQYPQSPPSATYTVSVSAPRFQSRPWHGVVGAFVLVFGGLALMNPTMDDFVAWAVRQVEQQMERPKDGMEALGIVMGKAIADPIIKSSTTRRNWLICSTFEWGSEPGQPPYRVLGVLKLFIPIRMPVQEPRGAQLPPPPASDSAPKSSVNEYQPPHPMPRNPRPYYMPAPADAAYPHFPPPTLPVQPEVPAQVLKPAPAKPSNVEDGIPPGIGYVHPDQLPQASRPQGGFGNIGGGSSSGFAGGPVSVPGPTKPLTPREIHPNSPQQPRNGGFGGF